MKILIIGDAQHGKDTVAEMMKDLFNMKFESSSKAALRLFLYDRLVDHYNMGYLTHDQAYEDRIYHRKLWYDEIVEYCKTNDLTAQILEKSNIYVGMRNIEELNKAREAGHFDLIVGVYNPYKKNESSNSNTINVFEESDIIILNNSGLEELKKQVDVLIGACIESFESQIIHY